MNDRLTEFARLSALTLKATAEGTAHGRRTEKSHAALLPQSAHAGSAAAHEQRVLRSDALLQGHNLVLIAHNGETYQLRETRLGKLILTK